MELENNVFFIFAKDKFEFRSANTTAKVVYKTADAESAYKYYVRESPKLNPAGNIMFEIQDKSGNIIDIKTLKTLLIESGKVIE